MTGSIGSTRRLLAAGLTLFTGLGAAAVVAAAPAFAAGTTLTVTTTADIAASQGACGNSSITTAPSPLSLREATCLANNLGGTVTINVPAGHYYLPNGELQPGQHSGQNVTIAGAGSASTIIDAQHVGRVFDIDMNSVGGVVASLTGLTVTNGVASSIGGGGILAGSATASTADSLTVANSVISNNESDHGTPADTGQPGGGLQFEGGSLILFAVTVSGNQSHSSWGSGVEYRAGGFASPESLTVHDSTFANNHADLVASGGISGGALYAGGTGTSLNVTNSRFTGNGVSSTGTEQAAGAAILSPSGNLTVTGTTFTGNTLSASGAGGIAGGAAVYSSGTATLHYDRITGNTGQAVTAGGAGAINAGDDWWGCNTGANTTGCDTAGSSGITNLSSFLKLVATASPSHVVGPNGTATITAALTTDSLGASVSGSNLAGAFDTVLVTFGDPPGDATVAVRTAPLSSGQVSVGYNSHTTLGPDNDTVTLDNATVSAVIEVDEAPAITSASTANFALGQPGSFTVTTTGYPSATLTESGTLPPGLTFADNGNGTATIAGTATVGGSYPITVSANNGYSPNATQPLTVTVSQAPAFTSPSTATFTAGSTGSFAITTSGVPTVSTIDASFTPPVPCCFSLIDYGNGTGKLVDNAGAGTGGVYSLTLTATNGVSPDATQNVTIVVNQAPKVTTTPADQSVQPGTSVTFTAAANGYPTPTVQWQRSTDAGATFTNIAGATSTSYTFTAASGDDRSQYRAVFTNVAGTDQSTAATLHVGTAPAFTSADHTAFVSGGAGTFTVTVTGVPNAAISESGDLPASVTFHDNGDGTATLAGTPAAAEAGAYPVTLTATNGFAPDAHQNFTLNVDTAPTITSVDTATYTTGQATSFTVTTTPGYPTSTSIAENGTLPAGVTFHDNGDGTATLAGTPNAGTGGVYTVTLTASNGVGPDATQTFTLTVDESARITSADHGTFDALTDGTFTVTTSAGYPTAVTLTKTGTLPSGVTFTDNGNGTATLAGTPNAGSGGVYTLTIRASNGVDPAATQSFTLTVNEPAHITSADHAGFTATVPDAFTVTTAGGQPSAITLTETGALPSGVTFTDNGNGTATLAGTGTEVGGFPITITASNGVLPDATQTFTLTVARTAQTITVTSADPGTGTVGGTYTPAATTDSGLPVTYAIDAATTGQACSFDGTTVSFDHAGTCVVDFDQPGGGAYAAADEVQVRIAISAIATTTSLTGPTAPSVYGQPVTAIATVAAGTAAPPGTVQFTVDGTAVGSPVQVGDGTVTSPQLGTLTPGTHTVTAAFTPTDATTYAGSLATATVTVTQAATTTTVKVGIRSVTATVAPVAPGAGGPTGAVTFTVGGHPIGTAPLVDGVATLGQPVAAGATRTVGAIYSGDANFTASSASMSRHDPSITATTTASRPKSRYGWYRTSVTIQFICTPNGAPLTGPCPAAVHLTGNGAAQSVTRTITATDGGAATVAVSGINIDQAAPTVRIAGVRNGAVYSGAAPAARCVARDAVSGVVGCALTTAPAAHGFARVTATATDQAGNTARVTATYQVLGTYVAGARYDRGAFDLRAGHTYTLVVASSSRPQYYDAAVYPRRPGPADAMFHPAGRGRWTLGVTVDRSMRSHPLWNIGIKVGTHLYVIKVRIA